ncbi:HotDog domain-containing protein [Aspergillus foveolatus]|uniref:HotDog domain-containing protein n=1 Tax=Aspergillus foveolatus TaxID=210207 RepID=UPI003CCC9202
MKPAFAAGACISLIAKCCAITPAPDISLDTYTNVNPIWHPPGTQGIYGGAATAQCLNAAYETVAPDFVVHSMHCHFLLAGNSNLPVRYSVERIRDREEQYHSKCSSLSRRRMFFHYYGVFSEDGYAELASPHGCSSPASWHKTTGKYYGRKPMP